MYPSEKDKQYFFELLTKYNSGSTTTQETEFVERFLAIMDHRNSDVLTGFEEQKNSIEKDIEARLLNSIQQDVKAPAIPRIVHRVHFLRRSGWWAAAAILLVLLSVGTYYLFNQSSASLPAATVAAVMNDVKPGTEGAMLTLADGRQVLLDSLGNGIIAMQGNAEIKLNDGQLVYNKAGKGSALNAGATVYNTMSTPRGRQFQLMLPDGTKVWLNAASSLTYPVAFTGKERKVAITGEAYFEVAKNAHLPFRVTINDQTEVEVLGTHFNVNAYSDEEVIKTTLLEGSVKVKHAAKPQISDLRLPTSVVLTPGQQAQVSGKDSTVKLVKEANVNEAMAWKNGTFSFTNADLPAVMRQLSRWYNIEIEYKGDIPGGTFSGEIGRSLTLDQVLKGLTTTRIHYHIEKDNKLLILP
jgi:ferric-dicitrate binding protein FerR (iron transport regulator)